MLNFKKIIFLLVLFYVFQTHGQAQVIDASNKIRYWKEPNPAISTVTARPVVWSDLLYANSEMSKGDMKTSASGQFVFQKDGNVVLFDKNKKPMWAAGNHGSAGEKLAFLEGALVLHKHKQVLWTVRAKEGRGNPKLQVDWSSYTLRIIDAAGTILWKSK